MENLSRRAFLRMTAALAATGALAWQSDKLEVKADDAEEDDRGKPEEELFPATWPYSWNGYRDYDYSLIDFKYRGDVYMVTIDGGKTWREYEADND